MDPNWAKILDPSDHFYFMKDEIFAWLVQAEMKYGIFSWRRYRYPYQENMFGFCLL